MRHFSTTMPAGLCRAAGAPASIGTVNNQGTIAFSTPASVPVGTSMAGSFPYDTTAAGLLADGITQDTADGETVPIVAVSAFSPTGRLEAAMTASRTQPSASTALSSNSPPDPFPAGFAQGNFAFGCLVVESGDGAPAGFHAVPKSSSGALGAALLGLGIHQTTSSRKEHNHAA